MSHFNAWVKKRSKNERMICILCCDDWWKERQITKIGENRGEGNSGVDETKRKRVHKEGRKLLLCLRMVDGICCGVKRWFERRGIWGWIDEGEIVKGKKEVRLIGLENSEQMGKYGTKEKKSVGLIGLLWMWCECRQKRKNRKEKVGWQMILSFVFVKKTWLGNELERKRNVLGKRI